MTTGDLRAAELGSWLQPTKADYYLQRLSVLHRNRKTAKVQGIVQRTRDAQLGEPSRAHQGGVDIDQEEERVRIMAQQFSHIAE